MDHFVPSLHRLREMFVPDVALLELALRISIVYLFLLVIHRSPQSDVVLDSTVKNIRLSHGILQRPSQSHPRRVPGFLTIPQLSKTLGIARSWIHDRIGNGTIAVKKDPTTRCYLFPDKPETLDQFRQLHLGQIDRLGC